MNFVEWLKLPETRDINDLDDPSTTLLHARIVKKKPFLKKLYTDFYQQMAKSIPQGSDKIIVELGSGGGFIKEIIPNAITSDILKLPNVDKVFSALDMPFDEASVDAFVMFDVLHHIAEPKAFFTEALRCLKIDGNIILIEPANTCWANFIYKNFHHESFDTTADWHLDEKGPLSHANGAIPWIIFSRDRKIFQSQFPSCKIVGIRNHTPLRYLLSGGLTLRQLLPSVAYPFVKAIEWILSPANNILGMFQTIELKKID